ncbi:bifunctional metallophosphatase/5'-nucleotidase [Thermoflavimicrobium dichotomicum]|uniref:2',3'-cyclic-nucleotide 2'-phosphodiesterase/5'-or 3'-nucleotidase, 5'-nucleotidase family n=1 Tax=Thermoflavimicrobium dichotomicum TaxID=46223 RepID=A0A1I3LXG4_9BACL|nr:bifunctional UDP-sugar hydrolase/5'-nucleotidase [Thermoflavimicrobium dichotomicum]SFI89429.1 2',3'-cyclic-nucleotide 2'-phosphodiesterase/5'-or 3'-nucleotidase, 5'-nucleotidase family [Thermoflavimicrobium dichotomicum]
MGQVKRLYILHTNDLHSHLDQTPQIYSLVQRLRQEWSNQGVEGLLVDIGDHMDRARMETEGTDGLVNGAILEATQYDAITLGNNELLTFSKEELRLTYKDASFIVISSNVVDQETDQQPDWLKPWKVFMVNGLRVGVTAVTVPYPSVYELMGWKVQDPLHCLQQVVQKLRSSVDVFIVLSHLGYQRDREMAEVIPGIDLIIGAHTHHLLEEAEQVGTTWIVAAGKFGEYVGKVILEWDVEQSKLQKVTGCCLSVAHEKKANEITHLLSEYREQAKTKLAEPIAYMEKPLQIDWQGESPFGNLLADSLRSWVGAEAALVNSGQLLDHLPAGKITKGQVHALCPHPINPVLLQITGKEIRQTLEESLLDEFRERQIRGLGFRGKVLGSMCVSGLTVMYDPARPAYQRICSIRLGDHLLADNDEVQVATIDMFTFGSGYLALKKGKLLKYYLPEFLRDLIVAQLRQPHAIEECQKKRWIEV